MRSSTTGEAVSSTTGTDATGDLRDAPELAARIQTDLAAESGRPPTSPTGVSLLNALSQLVADPDFNRPAYHRESFREGADFDGDCVRTRHEVLQTEAEEFEMTANGCSVARGQWWEPYSGRWILNPEDLEVDHVVSLGDAWRSGAWAFTLEQKMEFSNQLANLNAIYGPENQSKADSGPAEYSPTNPLQRCSYLAQYASVKVAWGLSITPGDFEAIRTGLATCDTTEPAPPDESALALAMPEPTRGDQAPSSSIQTSTTQAPSTATTTIPPTTAPATTVATSSDCHPAYVQCLPNLPGDALNCGDIASGLKPVTLRDRTVDPYNLDGRGQTVDDGVGCEAG